MTPKQARGQLRQIAKEILPEVMASELFAALQAETATRLNALTAEVREQLKAMDQRSRDMQSFIMREVTNNIRAEVSPKSETKE